jgi:hypothetical protein
MTRRLGGSGSNPSVVMTGGSLLLALAGICGCGAGDDTMSTAPVATPVKDGGTIADATVADATSDAPLPLEEAGAPDGGDGAVGDASNGTPTATFSTSSLGLWSVAGDAGASASVDCSASGTQSFPIKNTGTGTLAISASTTGSAFSVSPSSLSLGAGTSGTLTLTASVPGSATAGVPLEGSLNLFTNDAAQTSVAIPLSVAPAGATIVIDQGADPSLNFPSSGLNTPTAPLTLTIKNTGTLPAGVFLGDPSAPGFSYSGVTDAGTTLAAGSALPVHFVFTATSTVAAQATSSVTVTGVTCGTNLSSIALAGHGAAGSLTGYPTAPIDFGNAECGGATPGGQQFTLTNTGSFDAHVTQAAVTGAAGFVASAAVGQTVPANGGKLVVTLSAPAAPTPSPLTPLTATLTMQTDADAAPQTITLTEEPHGAVLAFDTHATQGFGGFGQAVLLQSATQTFGVTNQGNEAASVTLTATSVAVADAGAGVPFSVSTGSFSIAASGTQTDSATYVATATAVQTGALAMTATGALCAPLPSAIPLSGTGVGGGPVVGPTSLAFLATCGGGAPAPQTFTVSNAGQADLTWEMSPVTGPGAANYSVSATPTPGLLHPGGSATVTVSVPAVPSPAVTSDPASYAAQIAITTDVPFDDTHVVSLAETPLGDALVVSQGRLRFGQFPINTTTAAETFTITNNANAGSPAANLSLTVGGPGGAAYTVATPTIANLAPGGGQSSPVGVTFTPTSATPYPGTLAITTTDALCAPLPNPVTLSGTGAQGKASISATTLTFGTDPADPKGLVNCGATGTPQTFTVSNVGNQAFQLTGLALGKGAASPYVVSGPTLPATLAIGASVTVTVTPNPIPGAVAQPNDASPFTDTLTVTTNAALDTPHTIALVMQARGAILADTPLATTWSFGTIGGGSVGTFTSTVTNTGNATASIALTGLAQPTIFGLENNPTIVAASDGTPVVTPVVGRFAPPSSNGQWSDQGTLAVTATQAFCAPLPAAWTSPKISVSGASNGSPPVTIAGSLTFPATSCGGGAPAARAVTLTNATNQALSFTASFNSGAFYTLVSSPGDAGAGTIPANGTATVLVTPANVAPGPNVLAGAAPYSDDLLVAVASSPPTSFTLPIAWTLNGAVFSLPDGAGPSQDAMGNHFYPADSQSGLEFPMKNTGTTSATVSFGIQPSGAFSFSPTPPIRVQPGVVALPRLTSGASDAACPALTSGSITFFYPAGSVCQPIPFSQISIRSCVGTF